MSAGRSYRQTSEVERLRAELAEARAAQVAAEHRAELAEMLRRTDRLFLMYEIALSVINYYAVAEHYPNVSDSDQGERARWTIDILKTIPTPARDRGPGRQDTEEARLRTIMGHLYSE